MPEREYPPLVMEDYFNPGFKTHPLIHVGSQDLEVWQTKEEQAHEGFHLTAAHDRDIAVARNIDSEYLAYWTTLIGSESLVNLEGLDSSIYLSQAIIDSKKAQNAIKEKMRPNSRLLPFLVTKRSEQLANILEIPLYGDVRINNLYGTKSGIRQLADKVGVPMSPGFICQTYQEIGKAIQNLGEKFTHVAVKHTLSASGYMSKKMPTAGIKDLTSEIDKLCGRKFVPGTDIFVVEGWIKSKSSLCAQIEIPPGEKPIVCAAWQQIIDDDGITYMGSGPLQLSPKAMTSLRDGINKLAKGLYDEGAIGLYGPDFMEVSEGESNIEPGICILTELNARNPVTALPLEAILQVRGFIGNSFCTTGIKLSTQAKFIEVAQLLKEKKLLITKKSPKARGVIPFNTLLLPYRSFDIIALGDSWEDTVNIVREVKEILKTGHS